MKSSNKPFLLFWFVTLPQAVNAAYLAYGYAQGRSASVLYMLIASLAVNIAFTAYAFINRRRDALEPPVFIAAATAFSLAIAAAVFFLADTAFIDGFVSARLVSILLCALSAVWALYGLAGLSPAKDSRRAAAALIAVPLAWFLLFNILSGAAFDTAVMILIIAGLFIMCFLIFRILRAPKAQSPDAEALKPPPRRRALYAIFSLALPLLGLLLNLSMDGAFGDYSDPLFFIVPVVNGILLLLPPPADKRLRILRFFLIAAATLYLVYFFVVFAPFMPFGVIASIVGVGALLLAPAGALTMQVLHLVNEWPQVSALYGKLRTGAVFIAGLFLLPLLLFTSYLGDRQNLLNAADYLEQNAAAVQKDVDPSRLARSIRHIRNIDRDTMYIPIIDTPFSGGTPFISDVYAALVLDHRVMEDEDLARLDQLFFDTREEEDDTMLDEPAAMDVTLKDVQTETRYDADIRAWRTWVHLTMQGPPQGENLEYVTTFSLPEGAYISDYYLDVSGARKKGILADERAALFVYQSIVSSAQDPGLLHYIGSRRLELRVFPFFENTLRTTGFEVIHAQSGVLTLGGKNVVLPAANAPDTYETPGAALLSAAAKQKLPLSPKRPLEYNFIIDASAHSDISAAVSRVEEYCALKQINDGQITFASYKLTPCSLADMRRQHVSPVGGFNLGLAVKNILQNAGDAKTPVIVFVTGNPNRALYPRTVSGLAEKYAESPYYYRLDADMTLVPYGLETNDAADSVASPLFVKARDYKGLRVRDDGQPEVVSLARETGFKASGNSYADALTLDTCYTAHPDMDKKLSLELLRGSFRTHVLTPQTSFIVVETYEQEEMLYEAQEKIIEEDKKTAKAESLDEPSPALYAAAALALLIIWRAYKKKRAKS
jgi:hypothetical protein